MTRSLRAKFILDLTGNVRNQARRFGGSFERMGRLGQRSFERVGRAADRANRAMNRAAVRGAKIGAVVGVAAAGLALQRLGNLEERLIRLGNEAGRTFEQMNALRDAVNDTANDSKIRLDPSELLGALEQIQEMTGNLDFGMAIRRELAIAIKATGQAGPVLGALVSTMYDNMGIRSPEAMREALDILTLQGRGGKFTIPNMAVQGPRLLAAFGAFGRGGVQGVTEAGALVQRFRQTTGGPEEATTAFQAIMRTFLDAEKIKKIDTIGRAHGFKARDADGKLRSPVELIKDLIRSAQGDPVKMSKLFDSEAMKGLLALIQEFNNFGDFPELDRMLNITTSGDVLSADAANVAKGFNSSGQALKNNIDDAVEDHLLEPLTKLTESINALLDSGIELTADDALNLALGAGGVALGVKGTAWALGRGGRRSRGGKGIPLAPGGAGGVDGVVPVFVTNFPGAFGNTGKKPGAKGGKSGPGRGSRPRSVDPRSRTGAINRLKNVGKTVGKWAGRGARVLSVPGAAFTAADIASDYLPPASDPSARAVLRGVGGLNATELLRRLEGLQGTAEDGVEETAVMRAQLVAELRQLQVVLRNLQQRDRVAIGPAPETGRILTGPQ